jgi:membrane associated rhomboid family serine protease
VIPLKDENPTSSFPIVTLLIIAACAVVYFVVQPHAQTGVVQSQITEECFTIEHAAIPEEVVDGHPLTAPLDSPVRAACAGASHTSTEVFPHKNVYLAILYSMFLHGSLLHIGGNMLFLWVFGNNIEDRMGKLGYIAFYLIGGLVAAMAHILSQPHSTVPVVGASGAIAAVMGAYLVLFPNAPVKTLIIFYLILFRTIRAKWLLLAWFVLQFFTGASSGVAWVAHVGGFVFGALVAFLLRGRLRPPGRWQPGPGWGRPAGQWGG